MENQKRGISLFAYYLLASSVVNLVWILLGTAAFLLLQPTINTNSLAIIFAIVLFVLIQKGLIVAGVTYWFHKSSGFDKASGAKFIGLYFGRFYCLILGAFLGAKLAGLPGAIIGALSFFFVGQWAGTKMGSFTGYQIARIFFITETKVKGTKAA